MATRRDLLGNVAAALAVTVIPRPAILEAVLAQPVPKPKADLSEAALEDMLVEIQQFNEKWYSEHAFTTRYVHRRVALNYTIISEEISDEDIYLDPPA